jgi:hypothetical protein
MKELTLYEVSMMTTAGDEYEVYHRFVHGVQNEPYVRLYEKFQRWLTHVNKQDKDMLSQFGIWYAELLLFFEIHYVFKDWYANTSFGLDSLPDSLKDFLKQKYPRYYDIITKR